MCSHQIKKQVKSCRQKCFIDPQREILFQCVCPLQEDESAVSAAEESCLGCSVLLKDTSAVSVLDTEEI